MLQSGANMALALKLKTWMTVLAVEECLGPSARFAFVERFVLLLRRVSKRGSTDVQNACLFLAVKYMSNKVYRLSDFVQVKRGRKRRRTDAKKMLEIECDVLKELDWDLGGARTPLSYLSERFAGTAGTDMQKAALVLVLYLALGEHEARSNVLQKQMADACIAEAGVAGASLDPPLDTSLQDEVRNVLTRVREDEGWHHVLLNSHVRDTWQELIGADLLVKTPAATEDDSDRLLDLPYIQE